MEMKILYAGLFFFIGWCWFYLFVRQFLYNFLVAFPLIRQIRSIQQDLMSPNALKYTTVSVIACTVFSAIVCAIIFLLCKSYLIYSFLAGAVIAFIMVIRKLKPTNPDMFDAFCISYYRFIPDDELRTATYNKDTHRMKLRLNAMHLSYDFIPRYQK